MYGLRIAGVPEAARDAFVEVPEGSPELTVDVVVGSSIVDVSRYEDDCVVLAATRRGRCEVHRVPASVMLVLPQPPPAHALVHPLLTVAASAHNRWRGALTVHGGAFLGGDGVWAVLADIEGGKSSMMASLARRGVPVLSDDLVVVLEDAVLPGPRSIDLRPDAAVHIPGSEDIGFVGRRERHRIALAQVPGDVALAGIITPDWSDDGEIEAIPLTFKERLHALSENGVLARLGPPPASLLFEAAAAPGYRLRRPRSWADHERVIDVVMDLTGARPAHP